MYFTKKKKIAVKIYIAQAQYYKIDQGCLFVVRPIS